MPTTESKGGRSGPAGQNVVAMIQRETPDSIVYVCSDCGEETEHQILRGRMGRATLEGTFRCNECGKITSETIRIPEVIEVPVVYSDGDVSEQARTTLESNDIVELENEFEMDDGRYVCVTYIEVADGRRVKRAVATDIRRLWVKRFDVLSLKVSVNDVGRTYPLRIEAEPDDEFVVGSLLKFEDFDCMIHAIKTKHSLVKHGSAEARDIVRIYGKIRKKSYDVLDFDDDFDESEYASDDDGEERSGRIDASPEFSESAVRALRLLIGALFGRGTG